MAEVVPWRRVEVLVALAVLTVLLVSNALRYPTDDGRDANRHEDYVETVREGRMPGPEDSQEFHIPPAWGMTAAVIESTSEAAGVDDGRRVVQLFNALLGVGVALVTCLLAREVGVGRRGQLVALFVAGFSAVLVRNAAMYHPEVQSAFLVAVGLWCAARWLRARQPALLAGAGVALGLSATTRTFGLAAAGAVGVWLLVRSRDWRVALRYGLPVAVLVLPWFAHSYVEYGTPLAFNRPEVDEPLWERQSAGFFVDVTGMSDPWRPHLDNQFVPVMYADWFGDYWRYWPERHPVDKADPAGLPMGAEGAAARRFQLVVGFVPTAAIVAGVVLALRRRRPAEVLMVLAAGFSLGAALYLAIKHPAPDGDTVQASFLLTALAPVAVLAGVAADRVGRRPYVAASIAGWAVLSLPFLAGAWA